MAKKKELAKVAEASVPAYLQGYKGPTGTEGIDNEDITIPMLKIGQGTTDEVKSGDMDEGDIFLNLTGAVLDGPVRMVIIDTSKEFILWRDRKDAGGGILARARKVIVDGEPRYAWDKPNTTFDNKVGGKVAVKWTTQDYIDQDKLDKWGSEIPGNVDSGIAATAHHNYLVVLPDHDYMVAAISMSRSQVKKARAFNSMLKMVPGNSFERQFEASTEEEVNKAGERYRNWKLRPAGKVPEDEGERVFNLFTEFNSEASTKVWAVDQTTEKGEGADEAGGF